MVVAGTEREKWYLEGRYRPYSKSTLLDLVADIKAIVPEYVASPAPARYPREIHHRRYKTPCAARSKKECRRRASHAAVSAAGNTGTHREGGKSGACLKQNGLRSIGGNRDFLSFENEPETLFGLLRLRIQTAAILPLQD